MRILVTGAGGFVGRNLAVALARAGHDVVALVRRNHPTMLDNQPGLRVERGDLATAQPLPAGPFDALLHCAAAIPSAVPDEAELTRINVEGAHRVFDYAVGAGAATVVFCSSIAVYGDIAENIVGPETPIGNPKAYGRSKLSGEAMLADLSRAHSALRAVSIRLPGVVGRGSHHNFLSDTMARLGSGEMVVVRNPDAPFNNVVHVDDLSRFVALLLRSLPTGHRAITVGSEEPLPVRDVVSILQAATGRRGAVRYENAGRSFLISSEAACGLGYRPARVRDSVQRFAAAEAAEFGAARSSSVPRV